ncbi:hypothetical protein MTO96_011647 [Rhipicephalus appendiculatus]
MAPCSLEYGARRHRFPTQRGYPPLWIIGPFPPVRALDSLEHTYKRMDDMFKERLEQEAASATGSRLQNKAQEATTAPLPSQPAPANAAPTTANADPAKATAVRETKSDPCLDLSSYERAKTRLAIATNQGVNQPA